MGAQWATVPATGLSAAQTPDGKQLIVADMHLAVAATGALVPATSPDPPLGTDRVGSR